MYNIRWVVCVLYINAVLYSHHSVSANENNYHKSILQSLHAALVQQPFTKRV